MVFIFRFAIQHLYHFIERIATYSRKLTITESPTKGKTAMMQLLHNNASNKEIEIIYNYYDYGVY